MQALLDACKAAQRLALGPPKSPMAAKSRERLLLVAFLAWVGLGADGLSSSAYGPEAALTILIPAGALGLQVIAPIMAAILVLLVLLCFSYWQTI